jgi:hypothetical protein
MLGKRHICNMRRMTYRMTSSCIRLWRWELVEIHSSIVVGCRQQMLVWVSGTGVHICTCRIRWKDTLNWPAKGARPSSPLKISQRFYGDSRVLIGVSYIGLRVNKFARNCFAGRCLKEKQLSTTIVSHQYFAIFREVHGRDCTIVLFDDLCSSIL